MLLIADHGHLKWNKKTRDLNEKVKFIKFLFYSLIWMIFLNKISIYLRESNFDGESEIFFLLKPKREIF